MRTRRRASLDSAAAKAAPSVTAIDLLSHDDTFELVANFLGAWSYLNLASVCKAFAHFVWAHVLRILDRVQTSEERRESFVRNVATVYTDMPSRCAVLRHRTPGSLPTRRSLAELRVSGERELIARFRRSSARCRVRRR